VRTARVANFLWQWVGVAPIAISIPLLLSFIFGGSVQKSLFELGLESTATAAYAIAVVFAVHEGVPAKHMMGLPEWWNRALGVVYFLGSKAIWITAGVLVVIATVGSQVPALEVSLRADVVHAVGFTAAISAAILGLIVVILDLDRTEPAQGVHVEAGSES
jgi:hypothetical protein